MRKLLGALTLFIALSLVLSTSACGGGEDVATPTPADTGTPTATATPTETPTPTVSEVTRWKIALTRGAGPLFPGTAYQKFVDLAEEYTDGRLIVELYPHSSLYPSEVMWDATITGGMDMFLQTAYYATNAFPDMWVWFAIQGLFESREHCRACLEDGRLEQMMAAKLEEEFPVKVLGLFPFGVNVAIMSRDVEIISLDDLEGLRTNSYPGQPPGPVQDYAGMVGVPISLEEMYPAFLTGVVDTVQLPVTSMREAQIYEVGNHLYVYPGGCYVIMGAVNRESWDSLPPDVQDIVENKVWPEVFEWALDEMEAFEDQELQFLRDNLETVHVATAEDHAKFWEAVKDHPIHKMMFLMVDPAIIEIVEELRPSKQ